MSVSVRSSIGVVIGTICLLLAGLLYIAHLQSLNAAEQVRAEARRTESYRLAEQMRQSSNELTMMVRLYVSTGEKRYHDYFEQILAIRSGAAPRPENYNGSFWDRVLAQGPIGVQYGPAQSLTGLMRDAHFADNEFTALSASREASDGLARIESDVMQGLQALALQPRDAAYAQRAQPFYAKLVSAEYFNDKSRIMAAIDRFIGLVDRRTLSDVQTLQQRSRKLLELQVALVVILLLASLAALFAAQRGLVRPLQRLIDSTRRIAAGDYQQRVQLTAVSELRQLGHSFNDMTAAIQVDIERRQQAEQRALDAQAEAQRADKAKSAFLANMSHEIRTPLNAVIGLSELLRETELGAEQRDSVEIIHGSGEHLLSVINDILDFTKVEAGMLELDEQVFDLRRTVEEALELVSVKAAEKQLDLAYEFADGTPEAIQGDRGRIRQVLVNYLSNAIKFTEHGEVLVSVSATSAEADRKTLHVAVRDTGIGIPEDRRDRLFKTFSQVDASTTRRYGGTGLGLAISKRLVECMGGEVSVSSQVGVGSTFFFSFVATADPAWHVPQRADASLLVGKRLLVVDDNDTNRRILRATAREWGLQVSDVATPAEAIKLIEAGVHFDLGVLDYLMPDMDGAELAAVIRRHRDHSQLRLLLLSSVRRTARALPDFDLVLLKPLRRAALLDALLELLADEAARTRTAALNAGPRPAAASARAAALRILLVEDNTINQKVAMRILESLGYRADLAQDGVAAIHAIEQQRYDVVLMDVQMPVMDGLEATRRIRRLQHRPQPRIFAMTASVLDSERQECIDAGMERHIAKPIRRQQLLEVLEEVSRGLMATQAPQDPVAAAVPAHQLDEQVLAALVKELGAGSASEVIDEMTAQAPADAAQLRAAADSADALRVRQLLRAMKANCDMVGAHSLADRCRQLERGAPEPADAQAMSRQAALIAEVYLQLCAGLQQWSAALRGV
jgi:signal transduction histidine kinase/DNA-binding response OmpR family regulator